MPKQSQIERAIHALQHEIDIRVAAQDHLKRLATPHKAKPRRAKGEPKAGPQEA